MTPARKDLELRLRVVADAQQGVQAMNQLAQAAQRVEHAGARASAALAGRPVIGSPTGAALGLGLGAGGVPGMAGGAGGMSFMGFGKAAFGYLAAQQTIERIGNVGGILRDPFTTNTQTARSLFRQLPLGETLQGAYDSLSGRKANMALEDFRFQQAQAGIPGELREIGYGATSRAQQAGLAARAAGLARSSPILEGYSNRSTALGQREFEEKQRLLPIQRDIARAEVEASAASAERVQAAKELQGIERRSREEAERRVGLERRLADTGGGVDRQRVLNEIAESQRRTTGLAELKSAAAERSGAAARAAAEAAYGVGRGRVQSSLAQAGILEGRAASAASGAARLGAMDPFERSNALYSLDLLKRYGPDMLSPEQKSAAASLAPQTANKIFEQRGAAAGEFQQLQRIAPADFAGNPDDLRRRAGELRDDAAKSQLELDRSLADASVSAASEIAKAVTEAMRLISAETVRQIKTELLRGKNTSS
jgi:hypothetical protein